jgi:hypothetical protein
LAFRDFTMSLLLSHCIMVSVIMFEVVDL